MVCLLVCKTCDRADDELVGRKAEHLPSSHPVDFLRGGPDHDAVGDDGFSHGAPPVPTHPLFGVQVLALQLGQEDEGVGNP